MKDSKIEWCDHTFNPWIGCTRVSPGCVNCYAEQMMDKRMGVVRWGPGQPRKRTHERNWNAVRKWNKDASGWCNHCNGLVSDRFASCRKCGWSTRPPTANERPRVFCASLADWLDPEVPVEWLADLLGLIHETPHLDWLLLTKRPELWRERIELAHDFTQNESLGRMLYEWLSLYEGLTGGPWPHKMPANVWIGATVEDQRRADERIPELLKIPARVRFLSCEPLLGALNLRRIVYREGRHLDALRGYCEKGMDTSISWVICGGESGSGARPMHPDWARYLRDQCEGAGVPFFFKQWGEWLDAGDAVRRAEQGTPRRENERILNLDGGHGFHGKSAIVVARVGKHRAGLMLDGREHSAFPEVRS